ncbi:MAG: hypothetical protein M0R35_04060 [Candidatus Omnitrophica bacterium]|jgi:hypothetical protein|nr:hypothetical protein [Candidatus Omnitrophota bacterium]
MDKKILLKRIDDFIANYTEVRKKSQYDDLSDLHDDALTERLDTQALAIIESIAEKGSAYVMNSKWIDSAGHPHAVHIQRLVGILHALRADIDAGYLWRMSELINAGIFADFLEMARYLLEESYKDPAAVLVGGVLEENLRKLCLKNGITIEINKNGKILFKESSLMNDELKKANIYGNLEHKSIIAWLDLRNKAAHGKYSEYSKTQVENMLSGVRDFITRYIA